MSLPGSCVNCGLDASGLTSVCHFCGGDPSVPLAEMQRLLSNPSEDGIRVDRYPGENLALLFGGGIALGIVMVLGLLTLGVFLSLVLISVIGIVARQVAVQKNSGRVSATHFPRVFRLSQVAAFRLGMGPIPVYIQQRREWNAFAAGFGRRNFVVLDSQLASDLEAGELLFVLGHEMGHAGLGHTSLLHLTSPFRTASIGLYPLQLAFRPWNHRAEHSADRAGLIACQAVECAVSTLAKLAVGSEVNAKTMHTENDHESNWITILAQYLSSHPYTLDRIDRLTQYAKSVDCSAAAGRTGCPRNAAVGS